MSVHRAPVVRHAVKRLEAMLLLVMAVSAVPAFAGPAVHTVVIEGMQFSPATLTIRAGDTVVWQNRDAFPHDATAENKGFRSGSIPSQGSWKFIARKPGEFPYRCTLHPVMKAVLIVK